MTLRRFLGAGGVLWALAFWTPQLYDLYRLDGTAGLSPLSIFPFLDRTIYAVGYSNLGFMSVKPGVTRDEVVYSRTHRSSNYRKRIVEFSRGKVTAVVGGIYYD